MKRILALALVIILTLPMLASCGFIRDSIGSVLNKNSSGKDFDYDVNYYNNTAIIMEYTGKSASVVIPKNIDDYPVTEIGYYAFSGNTKIKSVTFPDTYSLYVNAGAFEGCTSLKDVIIPKNADFIIEIGAFEGCTALSKKSKDNILELNPYAFGYVWPETEIAKQVPAPDGTIHYINEYDDYIYASARMNLSNARVYVSKVKNNNTWREIEYDYEYDYDDYYGGEYTATNNNGYRIYLYWYQSDDGVYFYIEIMKDYY